MTQVWSMNGKKCSRNLKLSSRFVRLFAFFFNKIHFAVDCVRNWIWQNKGRQSNRHIEYLRFFILFAFLRFYIWISSCQYITYVHLSLSFCTPVWAWKNLSKRHLWHRNFKYTPFHHSQWFICWLLWFLFHFNWNRNKMLSNCQSAVFRIICVCVRD